MCIGKQRGECQQPYHRLDDLEASVADYYRTVTLSQAEREVLRDNLLGQLDQLATVKSTDLDAVAHELQSLRSQERKLLEAFYADSISPDLFHDEQRRLRRERIATEHKQEQVSSDLDVVRTNVDLNVGLTVDPSEAYRRADPRMRRLMNQGYFSALYVDQGDIVAGLMQPVFDELMAQRPRADGAVVTDRPVSAEVGVPLKDWNLHACFRREGSSFQRMVRRRGLEPPRGYPPQGPQPCASTNSATGAGGPRSIGGPHSR